MKTFFVAALLLFAVSILVLTPTSMALSMSSLRQQVQQDDIDLIAPQLLNQCGSNNNINMCTKGHVLTTLAMSLSSSHVKMNLVKNTNSPFYKFDQYDLLNHLTQHKQLTQQDLFPTTFTPLSSPLLQLLSDNVHYTMSFTPLDLVGNNKKNDNFLYEFCQSVSDAPAIYLGDSFESTIWLTHCQVNDKQDDIVITAHHPSKGEIVFESYEELIKNVTKLHQLYISYTPYQSKVYSQWSPLTNDDLYYDMMTMTSFDYMKMMWKQQLSQSIYHPRQMSQQPSSSHCMGHRVNANVMAEDDKWIIPHSYFVSWKQGDYPNDIMTTKTVAQVGCLMCSVAVGLRNRNITLPGGTIVDPHTWNDFIKANDGYDNDNFIHTTVNPICGKEERKDIHCYTNYNEEDGRHPTNDLSIEQIIAMLKESKRHIVANVNGGRHFVPIVGWSTTNNGRFKTFDSAGGTHGREWFDHSEIVGWRLYDLTGPFDW